MRTIGLDILLCDPVSISYTKGKERVSFVSLMSSQKFGVFVSFLCDYE